jgi:peptidyl-prolyl cis-trans isomerase D
MFNLFRSQKQSVRYLLGGILVLVAISMVITLVPGLYSGAATNTAGDFVLATVGDTDLTLQEVEIRFRDLQIGAEGDPQTLRISALNTIDSMIMEKVLLQEATDLGLTPDAEDLAAWLKLQLPFLFPDGVFVGRPQYEMFVQQRFRRSIPQFEAELARSLAVDTRLRRLVTSSVIVTDEDAREAYRRQNEAAQVEFVKVSMQEIAQRLNPTEEQLTEYFTANQARYRIPELRDLKLLTVDFSGQPDPTVADAAIEAYYFRNRSLYENPERVHASHILFMTQGKPEAEVPAIKAKAEEVLKRAKEGADFAALAKQYSEDPGSAANGGDLNWVTRGQMVPEFEQAAFAQQPGTISDLIKTEFGFHIIKVLEKEPERLKPLAEVRDDIRNAVIQEERESERLRLVDQVVDAAHAAGKDLESVAAQFNLTVRTLKGVNPSQPPAELANSREFLDSLFQSPEGQAFSEGREASTLIAVVTGITPSRAAEFAEVREPVRQAYIRTEARKLATEQAQQIAAQAKESGVTLQQAAAKHNLKAQTTGFVKPGDTIPDLGPAQTLGESAYNEAPGTIVGPLPAASDFVIYRVVAHQEADMSGFEDQKGTLIQQQTTARQDEAYRLFISAVRQRYQEEGRITRYQNRIDQFLDTLVRRG